MSQESKIKTLFSFIQIYTANYGSGSWSSVSLSDDGKISQVDTDEIFYSFNSPLLTDPAILIDKLFMLDAFSQVDRHLTFPSGNCTSHPHQTISRSHWLWIPDLGCDAIYTTSVDPGHYWWHLGQGIRTWAYTPVTPGCGPRHMVLHPSKDIAAVLCETKSLVLLFRCNNMVPM